MGAKKLKAVNSFELSQMIFDLKIEPHLKLTMLALASHYNVANDGEIYPKISRLGAMVNKRRTSVSSDIRKIEEQGLINVIPSYCSEISGGKTQRANNYEFTETFFLRSERDRLKYESNLLAGKDLEKINAKITKLQSRIDELANIPVETRLSVINGAKRVKKKSNSPLLAKKPSPHKVILTKNGPLLFNGKQTVSVASNRQSPVGTADTGCMPEATPNNLNTKNKSNNNNKPSGSLTQEEIKKSLKNYFNFSPKEIAKTLSKAKESNISHEELAKNVELGSRSPLFRATTTRAGRLVQSHLFLKRMIDMDEDALRKHSKSNWVIDFKNKWTSLGDVFSSEYEAIKSLFPDAITQFQARVPKAHSDDLVKEYTNAVGYPRLVRSHPDDFDDWLGYCEEQQKEPQIIQENPKAAMDPTPVIEEVSKKAEYSPEDYTKGRELVRKLLCGSNLSENEHPIFMSIQHDLTSDDYSEIGANDNPREVLKRCAIRGGLFHESDFVGGSYV